jgi:uncharacterized membrane protein YhhN
LVAVTKPTLLLSLIGFSLQGGFKSLDYPQKLFSFGLIFSLLGDVLLLNADWFIFGLVAFLIAQLAYMFAFFRSNLGRKGSVQLKPLLALPVFAFAAVVIYILSPKVGDLLPAIVVYTTVISLMLVAAINRKNIAPTKSSNLVIIGAILFVISDTILAFNKFHQPILQSGFFIMLTYGLAQYLLVKGFIVENRQ